MKMMAMKAVKMLVLMEIITALRRTKKMMVMKTMKMLVLTEIIMAVRGIEMMVMIMKVMAMAGKQNMAVTRTVMTETTVMTNKMM